jgi:hypothetical protein
MTFLKQALGVLTALVVLAVIVTFVSPNRALSRPRAAATSDPATTTDVTVTNTPNVHVTNTPLPVQTVTQATANYVTVSCPVGNYVISSCIYAAGTPPAHVSLGSTVFPLPSGESFVVTDISWTFGCGPYSNSAGDTVGVELTNSLGTLYSSVAILDAPGAWAGRADHFTSGLVLTGNPSWGGTVYDVDVCTPITGVIMQGYMVH